MTVVVPPELRRLLEASDAESRSLAWSAFVATHSRLLLHTARRLSPGGDAAMDAYAELLEGLSRSDYRRLRSYVADGRTKFTTWLVTVAQHLCFDFYRRRYGRADPAGSTGRETRRRLVDLVSERLDPNLMADVGTPSPTADLEARETTAALARALDSLSPHDRLLITLRFRDDLSAAEIGRIMGFATQFHVYRRLRQVLTTLRSQLEAQGVDGASQ